MKVSLDTNILFYAVDHDAGDRHRRSVELLARAARAECVQSLQSYGEFLVAVTRKGRLTPDRALEHIRDWRALFDLCLADETSFDLAAEAATTHFLGFWDAMVWATVRQAGCRILLTEDFQDGRTLGGVTFVDPFQPANRRLVDLALPPAAET